MKRRLLWFVRVAAIPVAFLCGAAAKPAFDFVCVLTLGRVVQSIESPDLMPFFDHEYRETLVWDTTGRIVVLELMAKHVFAYDAKEHRPLRKGELVRYTLYPQPTDYVYVELKDIDE